MYWGQGKEIPAHLVYDRHAWGRNPLSNLKADGIPLDVMRNDTLTVACMDEISTGKQNARPHILNETGLRELTKALMAGDVKRWRNAAEMFIMERPATCKAA